MPSDEDASSPSPPRIRSRRRNVRLRSPSPEEPRRRAQPGAGATAPVPRRPPPTPTPHQPRFTATVPPQAAPYSRLRWMLPQFKSTGSSCASKAARTPLGFRSEVKLLSQVNSPRVALHGCPVANCCLVLTSNMCHGCQQSGTVRVCVRVCVCHGVARIQSTDLSTGGSPRVHG